MNIRSYFWEDVKDGIVGVLKGVAVVVCAIAVFLTAIVLVAAGMQKLMDTVNGPNAKPVLEIVYTDLNYTVLRDTETNVLYAKTGGEMTPLINSDGTLKLYEGVDVP